MTARVLRGVAGTFLSTYLSRNSDYTGYWLFGFLVPALGEIRMDLLKPPSDDRPAFQYAVNLAAQRFAEQVKRVGLQLEQVRMAELTLSRDGAGLDLCVNGCAALGWTIRASVVVESDRGRRFVAEQCIVAAPHNEAAERRSARAA